MNYLQVVQLFRRTPNGSVLGANQQEAVRNSFDGASLTTSQTARGAAISGFLLLVCGRDTNQHHS